MTINRDLPRRLRSLFGTLAFLFLVMAGLSFAATWVVRTGLQREAVAEAGKVVGSVLEPALVPGDVREPVTGERYRDLRALARKRILAEPVTAVRIWNADGTVVFADRRSLVGESVPAMRETIRATLERGSMKAVEGDTFRALVALRLSGDAAAVVELDRSNAALAAQADARWRPWAERGLVGGFVSFALYLLAVSASILERRRRARTADRLPEPEHASVAPEREANVSVRHEPGVRGAQAASAKARAVAPREPGVRGAQAASAKARAVAPREEEPKADAPRPGAPAYVQPGFREHLEARQEAEEHLLASRQALAASEQERLRLQDRLRHAEAELEEARRRLDDLGATAGR